MGREEVALCRHSAIERSNDVHPRLGGAKTFAEYVRTLKALGEPLGSTTTNHLSPAYTTPHKRCGEGFR